MNETYTHGSHGPRKKTISKPPFDLTEETLDFKPITEGLGFHKQVDEPKKVYRSKAPAQMPSSRIDRRHPYNINKELGPSLVSTKTETLPEQKTENFKEENFGLESVLAYLCDFALLSLLFLVINYGFMRISLMSLESYSSLVLSFNFTMPLLFLFSILYIFYFTLVDSGKGLGKAVFNLELRTLTGEPVGLNESFFRAIVSLFSLPLLFLPLLLDFQGKISETKLVKLNEPRK